MVIDTVFPGWMPWRRFAVSQDVFDEFARVEDVRKMDWDTVVGGHVTRVGTHADVEMQAEFYRDIKQAAATALATTKIGETLNPLDKGNPWAVYDNYIDRVAAQCVNTLTPSGRPNSRATTFSSGPVLFDGANASHRLVGSNSRQRNVRKKACGTW